MKKIMLIDDRTSRQIKFTRDTGIDLEDYVDILDNFTAGLYDNLLEEFKQGNFSRLDKYDVIITHRSAFGEYNGKVLNTFKEICEKKQKSLVFFSGGISSSNINNNRFEHILMNSKIFYSTHLKLFLERLEKGELNLLILVLGENWKINLLLNSLEKSNLFICENKHKVEVPYKKFIKYTKIDLISHLLDIKEPRIVNNFVQMNDLTKFTDDLSNQIKQQVVLNV